MIGFNCPNCPTRIKARNRMAGKMMACPNCGFESQVPYEADVDVDARARRKARQRERDETVGRLGMVNLGLLLHYGGLVVLLGNLVLFGIGFALAIADAAMPGLRSTPVKEISDYVLMGAVVVLTLTVVGDELIGIFCLKVPIWLPYIFLRVWMVFRLFGFLGCLAFWPIWWFFEITTGPAVFVALLGLLSWALWVGFLMTLASGVGREDLQEELLWESLRLALSVAVTLGLLGGLLIAICATIVVDDPLSKVGILSGASFCLVMVWAAAWMVSGEDSYLLALLAPTGALATIRYLDAVGSLRIALDRCVE